MPAPEALIETDAMTALAEHAARVPKDRAIVEIGTYQGANLISMAKAAKRGQGAKCFGIDAYGQGEVYAGRPHMVDRYTHSDHDIAKDHIKANRLSRQAKIIVATSAQAAAQWDGPAIGLLVIDAEHRYHSVVADFTAWLPHLTDDAVIAFDDYGGSVGAEVKRAVDDLATQGQLAIDEVVGSRLALCRS